MVLERPGIESSVAVDSGSRHIARPSVGERAEHMQRSEAQADGGQECCRMEGARAHFHVVWLKNNAALI